MSDINNYNERNCMLRKHQMRMFEMLCAVDEICERHNINYWLSGGTLLGAVRHKGFIPWDDDLDIQLLKKDYNTLLSILETELPQNYKLQTNKTDENYFAKYAKIRDIESLIEEAPYASQYKYRGIFIDIFSVEYSSVFCVKATSFMQWYGLISIFTPIKVDYFCIRRRLLSAWYYILSFLYLLVGLFDRIFSSKINYSYGIYYPLNSDFETIFPLSKIEFEGRLFKAPKDCKTYLTNIYGDFMKLPPTEKREAHGIKIVYIR